MGKSQGNPQMAQRNADKDVLKKEDGTANERVLIFQS